MKKVLAGILGLTMVFAGGGFAFAASEVAINNTEVQALSSKQYLLKTQRGQKLVVKIDALVEKLANKPKKAQEIITRIDTILSKKNIDNPFVLHAVSYLRTSLQLVASSSNYEAITKKEKDKVNTSVLALQSHIATPMIQKIDGAMKQWKELTNRQESGDMELDVYIHDLQTGDDYNLAAELSDYVAKQSELDSDITGDLKANIKMTQAGETVSFNTSAAIDLIVKHGKGFLKLSDFVAEGDSDLVGGNYLVSYLRSLADTDKYFPLDSMGGQVMNSNLVMGNMGKMVNNPWFEAYGKEGNTYLLRPTRTICDFAFYGSTGTCTTKDYNMFLKSFQKGMKMSLVYNGKKAELLMVSQGEELQEGDTKIIFDEQAIDSVVMNIIPNQDTYKGEHFLINYKKGQDFVLDFIEKNNVLLFTAKFDRNNHLYTAKLDYTQKLDGKTNTMNAEYKNDMLKGDISFENLAGEFKMVFTSNDVLKTAYIDLAGTDKYEKEEYSTKLNYIRNQKLGFEIMVKNVRSMLDVDMELLFNDSDLTGGHSKVQFKEKQLQYDEETSRVLYMADYMPVFESDIQLENSKILGTTDVFDDEGKVLAIKHSGSYSNKQLDMKNSFDILGEAREDIAPNIGGEKVEGTFTITTDMRGNTNNLSMLLDMFAGTKKILNVTFKQIGTREYKDIEITAPKEDEVMQIAD